MLREKEERIREVLGEGRRSPDTVDREVLERFEYAYPGRPTELKIEMDEFTSVCPMTGLPDFATLEITYMPDRYCVELKSLKYYLMQYRNVGIFYEHVVNKILDDLVAVCAPSRMEVKGVFKVRGGMSMVARASVW